MAFKVLIIFSLFMAFVASGCSQGFKTSSLNSSSLSAPGAGSLIPGGTEPSPGAGSSSASAATGGLENHLSAELETVQMTVEITSLRSSHRHRSGDEMVVKELVLPVNSNCSSACRAGAGLAIFKIYATLEGVEAIDAQKIVIVRLSDQKAFDGRCNLQGNGNFCIAYFPPGELFRPDCSTGGGEATVATSGTYVGLKKGSYEIQVTYRNQSTRKSTIVIPDKGDDCVRDWGVNESPQQTFGSQRLPASEAHEPATFDTVSIYVVPSLMLILGLISGFNWRRKRVFGSDRTRGA